MFKGNDWGMTLVLNHNQIGKYKQLFWDCLEKEDRQGTHLYITEFTGKKSLKKYIPPYNTILTILQPKYLKKNLDLWLHCLICEWNLSTFFQTIFKKRTHDSYDKNSGRNFHIF